jgi:hypothetical protein
VPPRKGCRLPLFIELLLRPVTRPQLTRSNVDDPPPSLHEHYTRFIARHVDAVAIDIVIVAVLPFANMSGDQEQEYFADGISEDIITGLSKLRWFFVIARNSSAKAPRRLRSNPSRPPKMTSRLPMGRRC